MIRSLAMALGAVAVSLVAAEWVLRTWAPLHLAGVQTAYVYDEELGYRLKSDLHVFELSDHLEEMITNDLGTVNYQESFEGYEQRIFALGDSYTQGTGLPPDASYPFQMDLELNLLDSGEYRKRFAVVNLGLAAFGAEQSLLALERYAQEIGPPHVCAYLGSDNDVIDDTLFQSGYRHKHIVDGSPYWGRWTAPLQWASRFELFKRTKYAVSALRRMRLGVEGDSAPEAAEADATPEISVAEAGWPAIERVRAACEGHGAHFIVGWANHRSPSYAWLKRKAEAEGVAFADWLPGFESVRTAIPEAPLGNPHSSGHYRTWVNRVIAQTFAAEIRAAEGR